MAKTKKEYLQATRDELAFFMNMVRGIVYDDDVKFDMKYDIISDYQQRGTAVLNFARFGCDLISKKNYEKLYESYTAFINHYSRFICEDYKRG